MPTKTVAVILFTSRYVMYSVAKARLTKRGDVSVDSAFDNEKATSRTEPWDQSDKSDLEGGMETAVKEIVSGSSKKIDAVCVSCCRYLESTTPLDRGMPNSRYGIIEESAINRAWKGYDLYGRCRWHFQEHGMEPEIFVQTDVNLAALGEYHFRRNENTLVPPEDIQALIEAGYDRHTAAEHIARRSSVAYLKLSDTIDASICVGGEIIDTLANPIFGWRRPRRLFYDGIRDKFSGTCRVHRDCFSGLISSKAIAARLAEVGIEAPLHTLPPDDPIDYIIAHYAAQLCETLNAVFFPQVISVGGRTVEDRGKRANTTTRDISEIILQSFLNEIYSDYLLRRYPNHDDITRRHGYGNRLDRNMPDVGFIQPTRSEYPVAYGGLYYAGKEALSPNMGSANSRRKNV
ncbi:MAG: hypothetical protein AAF311_10410 [Pseudomonadota bacterium]